MTKIKILLFSCFAFMMAANLQAQCPLTGNPYGVGTAPTASGISISISVGGFGDCNFGGEDAALQNVVAGETYQLSADVASPTTFVTVYDNTGTLVPGAFGVIDNAGAVVTFTAPSSGDYTVVVTVDAVCGTDSSCRIVSVECTSCPPPAPVCGDAVCDIGQGEEYCNCSADCQCTGATPLFVTGYDTGAFAGSANPVAYCESEVNTGGSNSNPPTIYIPFAPFGNQACVTNWNVTTSGGTLYDSFDPITPSAAASNTSETNIILLGVTDADIAAASNIFTITFTDATTTGGCTFTLTIDITTAVDAAGSPWLGSAGAQCPGPQNCGNAVCDAGEDYCNCDADCACVTTAPVFINNITGTNALSTAPTVYCRDSVNTGGTANDTIFIPLAPFSQIACIPTWDMSTNFGTMYGSTDPATVSTDIGDGFIAYLALTDVDVTAAGGAASTVTVSFTDPSGNGCVHTLAVDLSTAIDASTGAAWGGVVSCGVTCPDDYAGGGLGNSQPALTGLVSASGTTDYETPGVISSTQTVDVNTDYDSGDCIDMQANFEVVLGVEFDAFIDGANCNGMGGNQFNGDSNTAARGTTANRSLDLDIRKSTDAVKVKSISIESIKRVK